MQWACFALLAALIITETASAELKLNLKSNSASNAYVNGQVVRVVATHAIGYGTKVRYHWQDFHGGQLSEPRPIDNDGDTEIIAPEGVLPAYIGLVFTPVDPGFALPGREPGEPDEYGFAVLPEPMHSAVDPQLWMGMVHADLKDPWLKGWGKTMTWKTTSAKWWSAEMEKRRALGWTELPIITGSDWKTDDQQPVSTRQLTELRQRVTDYLSADAQTLYWETGIEENLRGRFNTPFYFKNLAAKSDVIRSIADKVNPDIKLIFQIANMRFQDIGPFMQSAASANYDILALHPYRWPDFPPVEEWLVSFLADVRAQMEARGRTLPLWITEIGAPHHGNAPGEFFGYPKTGRAVHGLSRAEMVAYLIKFHVLSHHHGVEKVFWYNYRDRGDSRVYAEDHFGLIDYWGYPKPAYPAYLNLLDTLADKSPGEVWLLDEGIRAYGFTGKQDVIVAWSYPAERAALNLARLGLDDISQIRLTDALGNAIPLTGEIIGLTNEPVYIQINKN